MASVSFNIKKHIFFLLMFFFVFALILFLSEALLRFSGRVAVKGLHTASQQVFNSNPGIFEPGQNFIYRDNPKLPFHVSINSLGYRGPEFNLKKNPEKIRILCLGDSNTFGYVVDDEDTFPYKLQRLFEQQKDTVEVINGGVGGTTILDQFYFLKKGMEIDPDLVILTFFLNDIPELNKVMPLYISFEKNRKIKSSSLFGSVYELFRDTALFQLALKTKAKYRMLFDQKAQPGQGNNFDPVTLENETILRIRYAEIFSDLHNYLQKNSVKLMFVILPSHHQIGERTEFSDLHGLRIQWVERLAHKKGIPTVNLLKAFKETNLGKEQLHLLPYDGHPSVLAYDIVANTLFESLHKNFPALIYQN